MKKSNWKGKNGPLLIAEIGGNHEGNFSYAKKLTKLAIKSDVDVIKFQIYTGDTLVNKLSSPSRNKHFKKFQLTQDQHIYLAKMCNDNGVKSIIQPGGSINDKAIILEANKSGIAVVFTGMRHFKH